MERKYFVRLNEGHTARPDQEVNGYLGVNGKRVRYGSDASQKAAMFGGKKEFAPYSFTSKQLLVSQIDENCFVHGVDKLLRGREEFGTVTDGANDVFIYASIFDSLLNENPDLEETDKKAFDQLEELSEAFVMHDYIMIINRKSPYFGLG